MVKLYLTHQGLDDKIYMSSSTNGINWGSWIERGGATPTDSDNSPISPPTQLVGSTQQANSFFKLQYRNPTYNSSGRIAVQTVGTLV